MKQMMALPRSIRDSAARNLGTMLAKMSPSPDMRGKSIWTLAMAKTIGNLILVHHCETILDSLDTTRLMYWRVPLRLSSLLDTCFRRLDACRGSRLPFGGC